VDRIDVFENQIEYYGHAMRVLAVQINGQLVSESFQLFDASTETIASQICEECYASSGGEIATCGQSDIAVRKHGNRIYWFLADHEYVTPLITNIPLNHVWAFPLDNYESQLNANTSRLPDFSSTDIRLILSRATIYPPELGLFTIPDLEADPQGRILLDVITQVINSDDLTICSAPENYRTIRIGIETEGIPETIVEVGIVDGRVALRFVAHPSFPLWLASDEIHRNLSSLAA
jgi:hypothetical protein